MLVVVNLDPKRRLDIRPVEATAPSGVQTGGVHLLPRIHTLYNAIPLGPTDFRFHPFVGRAFAEPDKTTLRVMLVGVNAYISDGKDPGPAGFGDWLQKSDYRFSAGARRACAALAKQLADHPDHHGLRYRGAEEGLASLYATNAVRRYLDVAEGKHAAQLTEEHKDEGIRIGREELELLREADVLPHVVVAFGAVAWHVAWNSFGHEPADWLVGMHAPPEGSPLRHWVNRVVVRDIAGAERSIMLVRLRHPSARTKQGRVEDVVAHADFRALLGLP